MLLSHLLTHAIGRTKAGQFFNILMLLLFVIALPIGSVVGFSAFAWHEFEKEGGYFKRYGENWKVPYEEEQGSLTTARVRVGLALFAAVFNGILGIWLYRQIFPALRGEGQVSDWAGPRHRKSKSFK
jgi:hypothetical protein